MPESTTLDLLSRKLGTYVALSDTDLAAIAALPFTTRDAEPSTYIVRDGDKPTHCVVLLSGFAFRQKITGDGERQILSVHIPGEAVDLQNLYLDISDHNVQALTRARLGLIAQGDLRRLVADHPAIGHAVSVSNLVEASIFREWILNIGRRDARGRLAHLLCEFACRLEAQGISAEHGYELPMTQEHLADALGLTAVHVNRTLKSLQASGLITRNKRQVTIPDWKALREVGDFDSRYLHAESRHAA